MRYLRLFGFALVALAAFCSIMVAREFAFQNERHNELREALILLHAKGYPVEAQRIYDRLLLSLRRVPDDVLRDDLQRTMALVEPAKPNSSDPIWRYYWTVNNELNKRAERNLTSALKLAE